MLCGTASKMKIGRGERRKEKEKAEGNRRGEEMQRLERERKEGLGEHGGEEI